MIEITSQELKDTFLRLRELLIAPLPTHPPAQRIREKLTEISPQFPNNPIFDYVEKTLLEEYLFFGGSVSTCLYEVECMIKRGEWFKIHWS